MFPYRFIETDGELAAEVIRSMNALEASWPVLTDDHLADGWWWLLKDEHGILCGFAGMVENIPHLYEGYLKRAYVSPDHRGHGLQLKMIEARLTKAQELGWRQVVAETISRHSAHNLVRAGFQQCDPEQKWAGPNALYFAKYLTNAA